MPRYFILLLFVLTSGAGKAQMYLAPVYENSILKVIDTAGNVAGDAIDTLEVYDYMDCNWECTIYRTV